MASPSAELAFFGGVKGSVAVVGGGSAGLLEDVEPEGAGLLVDPAGLEDPTA